MTEKQGKQSKATGEFGRPAPGVEGTITVRTTQRQEQLDAIDTENEGHAVAGETGQGTGQVDDRNKQADEEQHHLRHIVGGRENKSDGS